MCIRDSNIRVKALKYNLIQYNTIRRECGVREKTTLVPQAMRKEAEGKNMKPVTRGIHRPKRGPDHGRMGVKLTLEELREEKRADPLTRQMPTAVLPPLAAAGAEDQGDYALSTSDRALAVSRVTDLRLLRRAFVGDYLATSTAVVPGGTGSGGGGGGGGGGGAGGSGNYAATAGLPFGIYKIISRMQAMARGYLTRKRMVEMKAVMRIQAMVRGRIARRIAEKKSGGKTFDAFVGTAKEKSGSKFKRLGNANDESPVSTPSITDSESEGEESESESEEGEEEYEESDDDI